VNKQDEILEMLESLVINIDQRFDKVETKIEKNIGNKIFSILDVYKQVNENVTQVKEKMNNLEN